MLRENLRRLSDQNKAHSKFNVDFLHYTSYHSKLRAAIDRYAKGEVLDIGCGNKPYENWFSGQITGYTGCDITQSDLQRVDVLCPANHIPLKSGTFDTVFSTQTIEHVEDHAGLIEEAFRLLKSDGCLILAGPMYWYLHEEPYDYFRFTRHGFIFLLEKAGFVVKEIHSNGGMWAVAGQTLVHAFAQSRSSNYILRSASFIFRKLRMYWLINSIFGWLDKVDFNEISTINYVVVAKKTA